MTNIGDMLMKAIENNHKKNKPLSDGLAQFLAHQDYWEEALEFIQEHIGDLVCVSNYYWYTHLLYGLNKKDIREFRYYKVGGYGWMQVHEFNRLLEHKSKLGIAMSVLDNQEIGPLGAQNIRLVCLEHI